MTSIAETGLALALALLSGCGSTAAAPTGAADDPAGDGAAIAAVGGTCIQNYWTAAGNSQNLTCTANDVTVSTARIVSVDGQAITANHPATCIVGSTFSFVAEFTVPLTAQTRYDVGLYFATDGDPNHDGAKTGVCTGNIITDFNSSTGLGSTDFIQLDPSPDTCGDIDAAHNPQVVTVAVNNVVCQDSDQNGLLNLPNCVSWRQPGSNQACDSIEDAYPGSPSKCNCNPNFNVPITVLDAAVVKSFVALACASVTYSVSITNTGSSALTLTALDDLSGSAADDCSSNCGGFGDLLTNSGAVSSSTCADNTVIQPGAANAYACTFAGTFCGASSNTDKIRATLSDGNGNTISEISNDVTVYVSASTTPP